MTVERNDVSEPQPIVVGVDGSKSSRDALGWAARQAKLIAAPLVVLTTWEYPMTYGYPVAWPDDIDFAADAKAEVEQEIKDVLDSDLGIVVTATVMEGHPAPALVEYSKNAALVVVGSRGHGEFTGMLLGSVSEFVATHAHCPVVIVRRPD